MKAITLWQPWATGMRLGLKTHETRSWPTRYRGLLAIHAGKHLDDEASKTLLGPDVVQFCGFVLGIVRVVNCFEIAGHGMTAQETAWGDWRPGRFAWATEPVLWFDVPRAAVGHQGLWNWTVPTDIEVDLTAIGEVS